jgi:hypothetical protein
MFGELIMGRKTVNVNCLREAANNMLATSTSSPEFRLGICVMIEQVLLDSDNYNGFRYLSEKEVPVGGDSGICLAEETNFVNDRSRRFYF